MYEVLKEARITQGEFASLVKVSRATINNWINGKNAPSNVVASQVRAMTRLIGLAVQQGSLPLPGGVSKEDRLAEIKKALKQAAASA